MNEKNWVEITAGWMGFKEANGLYFGGQVDDGLGGTRQIIKIKEFWNPKCNWNHLHMLKEMIREKGLALKYGEQLAFIMLLDPRCPVGAAVREGSYATQTQHLLAMEKAMDEADREQEHQDQDFEAQYHMRDEEGLS